MYDHLAPVPAIPPPTLKPAEPLKAMPKEGDKVAPAPEPAKPTDAPVPEQEIKLSE
jgi:hypothetical protein